MGGGGVSATTNPVNLALLLFAVMWAIVSGSMMLVSIYTGDELPAWGWAALFVASSLAVAYLFWRLW